MRKFLSTIRVLATRKQTGSLSTNEKILFTKRLALYLHSGIPIETALMLLTEDAKPGRAHVLLFSLITDITHGRSLATALQRFPKTFELFHTNLIRVGEASGTLSENLEHLSELLKRRSSMRKKVVSASIYPLIILIGTLSITLFLIIFAFPKIIPLFKGFHATLPFPTRILISISSLFTKHGILVFLGVISSAIALTVSIKNPRSRNKLHILLLSLPFFGTLITYYYIASISRTLSTLLQSGVHIAPALELTGAGFAHPTYHTSLQRICVEVRQGATLSSALRKEPRLYPRIACQLVSAGETTGTLAEGLSQIAQIYEEQFEEATKNIGTLIEPMLMIGMGLVVGFIALAIITPIYGLTQNLTLH